MSDAVRRVTDVAVALLLLVLGSPVILLVALAVRLGLGSPVLFRQRRLGLGGVPFDVLKFRTMRHPEPGLEGPEHDAMRLNALGRFLRSTSLDELPSFVNLLRGEITLVGPRPLPEHYWPRYLDDEYRRFEVKPGITGLAQVNGRNAIDWDTQLAFDVRYARERSLLGDLRILVSTVPMVLRRHGVDQTDGVTMPPLPKGRRRPGA